MFLNIQSPSPYKLIKYDYCGKIKINTHHPFPPKYNPNLAYIWFFHDYRDELQKFEIVWEFKMSICHQRFREKIWKN